ncbi:MAG: hypothetical protein LBO04_04060 [Spirochaetaceae bacterium]|jgi:hypothetical protein|nr:hypothetical protein [Spirochaetaceae bacterium]
MPGLVGKGGFVIAGDTEVYVIGEKPDPAPSGSADPSCRAAVRHGRRTAL